MSEVAPTQRTLDWLAAPWARKGAVPPLPISGLSMDSRRVVPGDAFVAVPGERGHGLAHAPDAVARGARAVLWDGADGVAVPNADDAAAAWVELPGLSDAVGHLASRFYGAPSEVLRVVAITGTDGKTSVSHYTAQLLEALGDPAAVVGTLGTGRLGRLHPGLHTTPDAVTLHQGLRACLDAGARSVAVEASSHALAQDRLQAVAVELAVFTNLGHDHLDYHGSHEAYAAAKTRLFLDMAPWAAVLNRDDAFGRRLHAAIRVPGGALTYSAQGAVEADLALAWCRATPEGLLLKPRDASVEEAVSVDLLGTFQADNVLAAVGAVRKLGHESAAIWRAVAGLRPVPGRMERFALEGGPTVVVDYAHTPGALEHAIDSLRAHCRGALWVVFGCGGDRDRAKRPRMGEIASRRADRVVVTDDNPRGEAPEAIVADILAGAAHRRVRVEHDRAAAIHWAVERAGPEDVVLIAGKGHENAQEIEGVAHPFSDREVVRSWMR